MALRSPQDVFHDYCGRRRGIINALTTDLDKFWEECSPEREGLCLYAHSDETWVVAPPQEDIPPELPEPTVGINFPRDDMPRNHWVQLIACHSDAWLLAVAFFSGARLNSAGREELFEYINGLDTCYESVQKMLQEQRAEGENPMVAAAGAAAAPPPQQRPLPTPPLAAPGGGLPPHPSQLTASPLDGNLPAASLPPIDPSVAAAVPVVGAEHPPGVAANGIQDGTKMTLPLALQPIATAAANLPTTHGVGDNATAANGTDKLNEESKQPNAVRKRRASARREYQELPFAERASPRKLSKGGFGRRGGARYRDDDAERQEDRAAEEGSQSDDGGASPRIADAHGRPWNVGKDGAHVPEDGGGGTDTHVQTLTGGDVEEPSPGQTKWPPCPNCGRLYREGAFWIECDRCEKWFDGKCVGMTQRKADALERNQKEWLCPFCVHKQEIS